MKNKINKISYTIYNLFVAISFVVVNVFINMIHVTIPLYLEIILLITILMGIIAIITEIIASNSKN